MEHGLDEDEVQAVHDLSDSIAGSTAEIRKHWLPYAVHAVEIAYDYAGDEYWPSFGGRTPGWTDSQASRELVRTVLKQFAGTYRGPTPEGRWANWFSIICWPIANAILPTDLQRHLARALFVAGPGLADRLDDIEALGRFVAKSSWEGPDRFQQLRDQPVFLGQIALALLRPQATDDSLLLDATLRRIVEDLESERSAASWIRKARKDAGRSLHFGGRRFGNQDEEGAGDRLERAARLSAPEVFLRFDRQRNTWGIWLALPNLSPLADISPIVRASLQRSRAWVPAADAPIGQGRLLFASQEIKLARWPAEGSPLIRFQGLAEGLEAALLRAWVAPELPAVFRELADGTARIVASRVIRPGRTYLVAHKSQPPKLRQTTSISDVEGAFIHRFTVAEFISPELERTYREIGCLPSQATTIWPAGSIPVLWDGEGAVEWLTTDSPMLGLSADHDPAEIRVSMAGAVATTRLTGRKPVFLSLPRLPAGLHDMAIRETGPAGDTVTRVISVRIREPISGHAASGPIRMWTEPYSTDLGRLWSGSVAVCVAGPQRETEMVISLYPRPGSEASITLRVPVAIPVDATQWRALLENVIRSQDRVALAFDDARWGRVEVDGGRFGLHSIEFERAVPPLRWRLSEGDTGWELELRDDGEGGAARVFAASFESPSVLEDQEVPKPGERLATAPVGGLYVARRNDDVAYQVVPPDKRVFRSFADFGYPGQIGEPSPGPDGLASRLNLLSLWSRAPLPGHPLASAWRAKTVRGLHESVIVRICGPRWIRAEADFLRHPTAESWNSLMRELIHSSSRLTADIVSRIVWAAEGTRGWSIERRIEVLRPLMTYAGIFGGEAWRVIASSRGTAAKDWAAEFFLRLATDPELDFWSGQTTIHGASLALAWPLPLRVARYFALGSAFEGPGPSSYPPLFAGWVWT